MSEFQEFEMVVVLRVRQRGMDASDATNRTQASLVSALRGKCLLPDSNARSGFWDDSLTTRVQCDRHGHLAQVLMVASVGDDKGHEP